MNALDNLSFIVERPNPHLSQLRNNKSHSQLPKANNIPMSRAAFRNNSNEPSFYSHNGNSLTDKSILLTNNDYAPEPLRMLKNPSMGNFHPHPPQGLSQSVFAGHARKSSHPLLMPSNLSAPSNIPPINLQPLTSSFAMTNYSNNLSSQFSARGMPNRQEEKVLMFLERQNAVIEKLALRIQMEETYQVQKEKRDLEQKLRDLQAEKIMRQHEDTMRSFSRSVVQTPARAEREKASKSKEKPQASTFEQLGKFYLMSKLFDDNRKKRSNPNIVIKTRVANKAPVQRDDDDDDDEDGPVRKRDGTSLGLENGRNRRAGLVPGALDFEDFEEYDIHGKARKSKRGSDDSDSDDGRSKSRKSKNKRKKNGRTSSMPETARLDAEEAKRQHEENMKEKERIGKIARGKLRWLLWGMTYSNILLEDVQRKVEKRKEDVQRLMSDNIQMNFEVAEAFILNVGDVFLKDLVKETKTLDLYIENKTISNSDLDARMAFIFAKLKSFFDKLIVGTNANNLSKNFLRFLASISEDSGVLPNNFMFDFEIKRLQFTYYATLKNMTPLKSKMVLGLFILLRVLVHKIIMRPWNCISGIKQNQVKINNLKVIGSILYHTVMDFFRSAVPIQHNNQIFLPVELKVKPRNAALTATDAAPDVKEQEALNKSKKDDKAKELEPIQGFFTKEQLKACFVDRKKMYDQLKALVDGWLEKMYQMTHDVYMKTPKEERENLGIPI